MTVETITNPIGVHALVWVGDTSPASLSYAIEKTKATGFDLLELSSSPSPRPS
ncbi:MAG: xylose isomerase protein [Sphaerisporangium sp.]|jgi:D-psicose/D-tagatose/L-ribulose 3-epimerase|nr:xylose isomerase protein [Sphaerisporangium sp.]